jgi:hypothetical protein
MPKQDVNSVLFHTAWQMADEAEENAMAIPKKSPC